MVNTFAIAARRRALGLTQVQLGELAGGLAQAVVSRAERHDDEADAARIRLAEVVGGLETERGITPARDHRLRQRRERLGFTPAQLAEVAGYYPTDWRGARMVCEVERGDATAAQTRELRRTLIWLETKDRRAREVDRRLDRANEVRRSLLAEVMAAAGEELADRLQWALLDRATEHLREGNGEMFDALAEWMDADEIAAAGERYVEECAPLIPDDKCGACVPPALVLP